LKSKKTTSLVESRRTVNISAMTAEELQDLLHGRMSWDDAVKKYPGNYLFCYEETTDDY